MKKHYLLIVAGSKIDSSTKFYRVAVGDGKKDTACIQSVNIWAKSNGYYMNLVSSEVDDFLYKIANSLDCKVYELPKMAINVDQLCKHINAFGRAPEIPPLSKNQAFLRQIVNPAAHFNRQLNVIRKAEAEQRQKPKVNSGSKI